MTSAGRIAPSPPIAPADAPQWAGQMLQGTVRWVLSLKRGPQVLTEYAKANLPKAADWRGGMIAVPDDVGGYTPAFCDGTNWRRTADRNIIS